MAERVYYMASRYFIYGVPDCPFCVKAMRELDDRKYAYYFFDLEEDEVFMSDVKDFYKHNTVPIVLENDIDTGATTFVGGCDSLLEKLND